MTSKKSAASGLIVLITAHLAALVGIFLLEDLWLQLLLAMIWIWLLLASILLLRKHVTSRQIMAALLHVFIVSTFLNQALLSLSAGFVTLFIYRLMMLACLAFFLGMMFRQHGLTDYWQDLPVKAYLGFFLVWAAYGALSLIWAPSFAEGLKYLLLLFMGILFVFFSVLIFREWHDLNLFYLLWLIMSAVLIVLGLINYFARIQLPTSSLYGGPSYKQGYPTAVFTNQNDFATFLSISFFFYLAYVRQRQAFAAKVFGYGGAVLSAFLIYLTDSRASEFAVLIGFLCYLFLALPRAMKKTVFTGAAVFAVVAGMFLAGSVSGKVTRLLTVETSYSINDVPASDTVRMHLLESTARYLAETYGAGTGAGNLSYDLQTQPVYNTNHIYEAHNWLAEITGTFGIFIGTGYLLIYLALLYCLYRFASPLPSGDRGRILRGTLAGMIAFLISSISPSSVSNLYFQWIFLGFILTLVSVLRRETSSQQMQRGNVKWQLSEE
ncbi:MAG: O-antigen ligase family protein [Sporolactobacillus sp.]